MVEFELEIPDTYSITDEIESHTSTIGDRVAIRYQDETGTRTERTYTDLRDDMNRFVTGLSELGVGEGDRVLHLFSWHPDAFAIQFGALKTGALLLSFMKEETAPYKYPRRIEFTEDLPKTASGKIRRIELRQQERVRLS